MTSRKMLKKISEEKTVQKDLQRITKLFQLHHPYLLRFGCGVCARCGKMEGEDGDVKLRLCGGCKMRNYCSTRCQKFDWRNGHREVCKRLRLESGDGAKGKAEIDSSASATAAAPSCSMPLDEANIVAENTKKKKKRKKKRKKKQGNGEGGEVTAEAASGRAAATARKQGAAKEDRSVFESPNMFNFAVRISNGQCTDGRPCRAYVDPNLEVDLIDAQFAMALGMQLRPMAANLRLENKETGEVGSHRLYETRGKCCGNPSCTVEKMPRLVLSTQVLMINVNKSSLPQPLPRALCDVKSFAPWQSWTEGRQLVATNDFLDGRRLILGKRWLEHFAGTKYDDRKCGQTQCKSSLLRESLVLLNCCNCQECEEKGPDAKDKFLHVFQSQGTDPRLHGKKFNGAPYRLKSISKAIVVKDRASWKAKMMKIGYRRSETESLLKKIYDGKIPLTAELKTALEDGSLCVLQFHGESGEAFSCGGTGIWLYTADGTVLCGDGFSMHPDVTWEEAEYQALVDGLRKARECGVKSLLVLGNAPAAMKLMISHVIPKEPSLRPLAEEALELVVSFENIDFRPILVDDNDSPRVFALAAARDVEEED